MVYKSVLLEAPVRIISPQEARDRKMFGPVYHGTQHDIADIIKTGFSIKNSIPRGIIGDRTYGTSNGYSMSQYHGIPAPIHHLGFGIYFTTVKAIAKVFNGNSIRGLKQFYIDSQNIDEINFGSTNTMMRWWLQNGYDMTYDEFKARDFKAWVRATGNLTRTLRKKYDAVWYKGKSIRKLLDGDQLCVYKPSLIYMVDPSKATGLEIGSKVTHVGKTDRYKGKNEFYVDSLNDNDFGKAGQLGSDWKGVFRSVDWEGKDIPRSGIKGIGNCPVHMIPPPNMVGTIVEIRERPGLPTIYDVKWAKGGTMFNYDADELKPYAKLKSS